MTNEEEIFKLEKGPLGEYMCKVSPQSVQPFWRRRFLNKLDGIRKRKRRKRKRKRKNKNNPSNNNRLPASLGSLTSNMCITFTITRAILKQEHKDFKQTLQMKVGLKKIICLQKQRFMKDINDRM